MQIVELDPMQKVVARCLSWLSFGADAREIELPIKIASYSEGSRAGGEQVGLFIIPLREAQMFWAAQKLSPFPAETALAIRRLSDRAQVTSWLYRCHGDEWAAWRSAWPFRPAEKLRRHIAEQMAERLGENPL